MKKKGLLFGITLLVLSLLLTGCGIAQSEYDAVVAERDALQSELDAARSQIAALQGDYATAQSEIEGLEGELSEARNNYDTLAQKVDEAKLYGEILEKYYFVPPFKVTPAESLELLVMIAKTDDNDVMEKWTTYSLNITEENRLAFYIAVWDRLWETLH